MSSPRTRRQIALKLGFPVERGGRLQPVGGFEATPGGAERRAADRDWREIVGNPKVDVVAELVGGTGVAREIIDGAIVNGKSVVTANKELMALCGAEIWIAPSRPGLIWRWKRAWRAEFRSMRCCAKGFRETESSPLREF